MTHTDHEFVKCSPEQTPVSAPHTHVSLVCFKAVFWQQSNLFSLHKVTCPRKQKKKKNYQSNLKLEEMIFTLIFPDPLWGLGLGTIHILSQQVSNLLKSFRQVVW